MKKLLVILTVAASNVCLSQIVVSVDDQNTLYRGYKNPVTIGTMDGRPFDLKVHNGTIIYDSIFVDNQNDGPFEYVETFFLAPGSEEKTKVVFVDPDTGLPFDTLDFHVKNLPAPSIYLGALEDGSDNPLGAIKAQTRLFAKYPPEIPFNVSFSVISWEVSVNGEKWIAGKGASLTSEARDLIRQAESGDKITFMTITVGADGKSFRRSAVFTVK